RPARERLLLLVLRHDPATADSCWCTRMKWIARPIPMPSTTHAVQNSGPAGLTWAIGAGVAAAWRAALACSIAKAITPCESGRITVPCGPLDSTGFGAAPPMFDWPPPGVCHALPPDCGAP